MLEPVGQVFQNTKSGFKKPGLLYLILFIPYIPMLFLGFGSDSDTFTVIDVWKKYLVTGDYVPSRLPGYVIHEFITYLLAQVGGSFLSNLVTLGFSILLVYLLMNLFNRFDIPRSVILVILLNPVFIVNATSTVDYLWALSCLVAGILLFIKKKNFMACFVLGLASAIRFTMLPLVAWVILFFFILSFINNRRSISSFILGGAVLLVINFAAFYLPLDFTEWHLERFFQTSLGGSVHWSPIMRVGRWGYKNLVFWGIPVVFLILSVIFLSLKNWRRNYQIEHRPLVICGVGIILITEIIFFFYPIEVEYLLPILPFTALLGGILMKRNSLLLVILSVLMLINGFYGISLARPDQPNQASSAVLSVALEQGYLLSGINERIPFAKCASNQCYAEVMTSLSQNTIK